MGRFVVHQEHTARHEALLQQRNEARERERQQAEQRLFEPASGDQVSYRAALAQAGEVRDMATMNQVYQQAVATGDRDLEQACAYHAIQRNWDQVTNDYTRRNLEAAQAYQQFLQNTLTERDQIRERLFSPRPDKPQELRKNAYDI